LIVITLTREQLHPVPEFNSAVDSAPPAGDGAIEERMLILVEYRKLMSSRPWVWSTVSRSDPWRIDEAKNRHD